jgi:hypothetical protein
MGIAEVRGMNVLRVSGALLIVAGLVACGGAGQEDPGELGGADDPAGANGPNGGPIVVGPDGVPVGPDGQPIPPKLDGTYELSNQFDLTSAGIFPDMVNDTLSSLSNFREHPTQTLVDLMDAANVPVAPQVLNAIPSLIRDQVFGFIDDHVFKSLYDKVPVTKQITGILDDLASIATKFEVVSILDVPEPNEIGDARGTHQLTGVAYTWNAKRTVINAPDVLTQFELKNVKLNAVPLEKLNAQLETGRLAIGDSAYAIPIGSFAVAGADALAKDKFGAKDLRDAIGMVVDCEALAKDVASRCIDPVGPGKVCVGHESEIENLCSTGLDVLVGVLKGQIKRLDLPALHLKDGTAKMWDAPTPGGAVDAVVDRIDTGFWTAGVGPDDKPVLATFTGKRIGESKWPSGPR